MVRTAMLMSAGLGTRMKPFTDLIPKPLLPVMGVPAMQFALDQLFRANVRRVVINVHAHAEKMREGIKNLELLGLALAISDESQKLLGSAGGLRHALAQFSGQPFFYINSDMVFDLDLHRLGQMHEVLKQKSGVKMTMAILPKSPKGDAYREIFVDYDKGLIKSLGEKTHGRPFFSGVAVIEPELIAGLEDGQEADLVSQVIQPAIERGEVGAFLTNGLWLDMGHPKNWLESHFQLMERFDKGTLSGPIKSRIEKNNRKWSEGIWSSLSVAEPGEHWKSPMYYSPLHTEIAGELPTPQTIGPHAVVYGAPDSSHSLSNQISLDQMVYKG